MSEPSPPPEQGVLHPVVRVALYLPALGAGTYALAVTAVLLLRAVPLTLPTDLLPPGSALDGSVVVSQGLSAAAIVLITLVFRRALDRRSFTSLGLGRSPGWLGEALIGFGLGVLLMALILAIELATGAYRLSGFAWQERPLGSVLPGLVAMFGVFVAVAFEEELVSRGYLLQNLAAGWGWPVAVALSSALFAVAHAWNPGANLPSMLGIFVAGVQFAAAYLATGRLWLPIGLHLSWNFFQGPIFGFPVSGLPSGGLLRLEPIGPESLTGGAFGPEASVVGLAVDLFGIWLIWLYARRRRASPGLVAGSRGGG